METQKSGDGGAYQDFCETAWRNAISINPDNPLAAAESIGDMHQALERVPQLYAEYCAIRPDMSAPEWEFVQSIIRQVGKALTKAKEKP